MFPERTYRFGMRRRSTIKKAYADRSVNARLAASLLASEEWVRVVGLDSPAVSELFEHLWEWPAVTNDTFDGWHDEWSNEAFEVAMGDELPPSLRDAAWRAGVPEDDLREVLESTTEAVYAHLFAAVNNERSLNYLERLGKVVGRYGISLPPPSLSPDEPYSLHDGWGLERSPDATNAWREMLRRAVNSGPKT